MSFSSLIFFILGTYFLKISLNIKEYSNFFLWLSLSKALAKTCNIIDHILTATDCEATARSLLFKVQNGYLGGLKSAGNAPDLQENISINSSKPKEKKKA